METWRRVSIVVVTLISLSLFSLYSYYFEDFSQYSMRDVWAMACFLLLAVLIVCFPININGTDIVFIQTVGLSIFLQFDIVIEAMITQIAILFFLVTHRVKIWYRYLVNISMFLLVSLGAGIAFYALGGDRTAILEGFDVFDLYPHRWICYCKCIY